MKTGTEIPSPDAPPAAPLGSLERMQAGLAQIERDKPLVCPPGVLAKLAALAWYTDQRRLGRIAADTLAVDLLLDSPDLAQWLHQAERKGVVDRTRFCNPQGLSRPMGAI